MTQNTPEDNPNAGSTQRVALAEALTQLRFKLLDLSAWNKLINFKHTIGKSLQFVDGQPSSVYQKLVESNGKTALPIIGLPEPDRSDWSENNGRLQRPDSKEWIKAKGISTSYDIAIDKEEEQKSYVRALMYADDLAKHCRKIERESHLAIEETGANMLFLILGFLEFPDQRDSDKLFMAPLINIPVTLIKKEVSGIQSFSLQHTGEDITENLSLREKIKNDFGLTLPELNEDQIDVEAYFSCITKMIKDQPKFSLKRRVSLSLLSFTNMLLVRDLDPAKWPSEGNKNALLDHLIIREVFEGSSEKSEIGEGKAKEHPVDEGNGAKIPLIYDADSSQHSALVDVLALKKNVVIEGPPGTGKSQTITNLIAACIAENKTVLFVAEKMAALEVVKTRLSLAGLDPFILELHSNKTNKKRVLEDIDKRLRFTNTPTPSLPRLLPQLESYRKALKSYSDLINDIICNSFGLTVHQVMWRAEKHRSISKGDKPLLNKISISDASEISEFELSRRQDCLSYLGDQYTAIGGYDETSSFWGFYPEWINRGDDVQIANLFTEMLDHVKKLIFDAENLSRIVSVKITGVTLEHTRSHIAVIKELINNCPEDISLHLVPAFFDQDKTGKKTKQILHALAHQIQLHKERLSVEEKNIKDESLVTQECIPGLRKLSLSAEALGVTLGNKGELLSLKERLNNAAEKFFPAIAAIKEFSKSRGIAFDGSLQYLRHLEHFANLILGMPEGHIHLQRSELAKIGATQALESLLCLQSKWIAFRAEIEESLYIDNLPSGENIKKAILTLREGDRWYRVFQSQWRSAVSLHKSLQRNKVKMQGKNRLAQLEKIIEMFQLEQKWKTDTGWKEFLGIDPPDDPISLDGFISLAKWNGLVLSAAESFISKGENYVEIAVSQPKLLKREFMVLKIELDSFNHAFGVINSELRRLHEFADGNLLEPTFDKVKSFIREMNPIIDFIKNAARDESLYADFVMSCEAALERRELELEISRNTEVKNLLGDFFAGVNTDIADAFDVLKFGQSIDQLNLFPFIQEALRSKHPIEIAKEIKTAFENIDAGLVALAKFEADLKSFGSFDQTTWLGVKIEDDLSVFAQSLYKRLDGAIQDAHLLIPWSLYVARRKEADQIGLVNFLILLESKQLDAADLSNDYAYCTYSTIVRKIFQTKPELGGFTGLKHNQIIADFRRLDKEIIKLRGREIAVDCLIRAYLPRGSNGVRVDDKTEMSLLNLLIPQQRPRMPVRKILLKAGKAIQGLKPCFMMGPQAVAQFLTPGAIKFDIVIMDEASQLKPEEAIGAIARGGQLVIVGDPKQLPPTSFFAARNQTVSTDEEFTITDAESILDICTSHFRPTRLLKWHYRSQHHSLIAFSNHNWYGDDLIVFPSPYDQGSKLGVRAVYLSDATYENQTNIREARRVVDAVVDHIIQRPNDSLGVVTLNMKQRDLIAELLEQRLTDDESAVLYREKWSAEGQSLFVKNLENVQGDERDAIIISTTFGRPHGSKVVRQNFGPISKQGGWRRLNVLFTRAKKSITIYTSMKPEDIVMDYSTPEGTKALRNYLEYIRTGLLTSADQTGREPDSDFEIAVIDLLRNKGYEVTPQLGVAGYSIDIAVKNPDMPGSYLAAIECDGATYHSALSVRDRDRIRQEILESLGWRDRIWRIWSTDWFRTPREEAEKLIGFLENLRKTWKPEYSSSESWMEESLYTPDTVEPISEPMVIDEERAVVSSALIESEEYLDIE